MKFCQDGPNIPNELFNKQLLGEVVFLCGAGVSLNAGMPDFIDLTDETLCNLNIESDSKIYREFEPWLDRKSGKKKTSLDYIFEMLQNVYGQERVNIAIAEILTEREKNNSDISQHEIISNISINKIGFPQIVTTNFDLLFERALNIKPPYSNPQLFPNLEEGETLEKITHLHGFLNTKNLYNQSFITSTSEFGSAYLFHGKQARFLRGLFKNYTVILIGFQAEDPPINYFLRGLRLEKNDGQSNIYAFDTVSDNLDKKKLWLEKGVNVIYCKTFKLLWKSLSAWQYWTKNRNHWDEWILSISTKCPTKVKEYERGQVVQYINTEYGAKKFSEADPTPHPGWMLVFEKNKNYRQYKFLKPYSTYSKNTKHEVKEPKENSTNFLDTSTLSSFNFKENSNYSTEFEYPTTVYPTKLPIRIENITNWLLKNLNNPITALWAITQQIIHPYITNSIQNKIISGEIEDPIAIKSWNLILTYQRDVQKSLNLVNCGETIAYLNSQSKELNTIIDIEYYTNPIIYFDSDSVDMAAWYLQSVKGIEWKYLFETFTTMFKIRFPSMNFEKLIILDENLESVFKIFENNIMKLSRYLYLLERHNEYYPTCYTEREVVENVNHGMWNEICQFYLKLFERMAKIDAYRTRKIVLNWPVKEQLFFRKFIFFALNNENIFNAYEDAKYIIDCAPEIFWDTKTRREILFLIIDKWSEFSEVHRIEIFNKILAGPPKEKILSEEQHKKFSSISTIKYGKLLILRNCELNEEQVVKLKEIESNCERVDENEILYLLEERGESCEDSKSNVHSSDYELVNYANDQSLQKIFLESTTLKSYEKLKIDLERKESRVQPLLLLLDYKYFEDDMETFLKVARLLFDVKTDCFIYALTPITHWIVKNMKILFELEEETFWNLLFRVLDGIRTDTKKYSIFDQVINDPFKIDDSQEFKVRIVFFSIFNLLKKYVYSKNQTITKKFESAIDQIFKFNHNCLDFAMRKIVKEIDYLVDVDINWVKTKLVPLFEVSNPASKYIWREFIELKKYKKNEIYKLISDKIPFIFDDMFPIEMEYKKRISNWLIVNVIKSEVSKGIVDYFFINKCLRQMNEELHCDIIEMFEVQGKNHEIGWKIIISLIKYSWPHDLRFKNSRTVSAWIKLLGATGDNFPYVYDYVFKFLAPVNICDECLTGFIGKNNDINFIVRRHPNKILSLLDIVISKNSKNVFSQLEKILNDICLVDSELSKCSMYIKLENIIRSG